MLQNWLFSDPDPETGHVWATKTPGGSYGRAAYDGSIGMSQPTSQSHLFYSLAVAEVGVQLIDAQEDLRYYKGKAEYFEKKYDKCDEILSAIADQVSEFAPQCSECYEE